MRRRDLTAALLVLTLGACAGRDERPDEVTPSADVACPETYDHELIEDSIGPTPELPQTATGAAIELRINVLDLAAEPPAVNLSWQTVPASDLPGSDRMFMKQQVGDVIDIDGVKLEITGICEGRVTFDRPA